MDEEPRKETKEERNQRKKKVQKALMKTFFPKKVKLLGKRRAPKVEFAEEGVGNYPSEAEVQG